jgi:antagonist of KipI
MTRIEVLSPGALTTVQDLGRPGFGHIGVSACGAADRMALQLGNLLLGNPAGAAALEMTLRGGRFQFLDSGSIAVTGAEFDAHLDGTPVPLWQSLQVLAGQTLTFGGSGTNARCYLCVGGGIDTPPVLESRSTHVASRLGGMEGRPLRKGDLLRAAPFGPFQAHRLREGLIERLRPLGSVLRVTEAAQTSRFSEAARVSLRDQTWKVQMDSNRMGVRLTGVGIDAPMGGEMTTEGAPLGAIQITPSGEPVILFVDHQTTGGYPKIACVISADHWRVGQLLPRQEVRFAWVSLEEARRLWLERCELVQPEVALEG